MMATPEATPEVVNVYVSPARWSPLDGLHPVSDIVRSTQLTVSGVVVSPPFRLDVGAVHAGPAVEAAGRVQFGEEWKRLCTR